MRFENKSNVTSFLAFFKKSMLPYVVGAALIFAGSIFANVIYQFFAGMNAAG